MMKNKPFEVASDVFEKAKNILFIVCSLASSFINLVFIANLTITPYSIGAKFSVPAAILLGIISISLDLSKLLHAIQINTLNELYRKLSEESWSKKIKRLIYKWTTVYLLYVALSICTSVSLSSISIGEGIHRNQSVIKMINKDISKLQIYMNADEASSNIEYNEIVNSVANSSNAANLAQNTFNKIQPMIEAYRQERASFPYAYALTEEVEYNGEKIIPNDYWDSKNNKIVLDVRAAGIELSLNQIRNSSYQNIQKIIKTSQEQVTSNTSLEDLRTLNAKTSEKYKQEIRNLQGKYTVPGGTAYLEFDENNLSGTIAKLETLRVTYENDHGDIGSSSKIFMQLGSTIDSKFKKNNNDLNKVLDTETEATIGTTEKLMMGMLLFLSLLCELAINQFAPKLVISRRMLYRFSQYFPKDFDVESFMEKQETELRTYNMLPVEEKKTKKTTRVVKKENDSKKLEEALQSFEKDLEEK